MAIKTYNEENIQAIADAIREKSGEEALYRVSDMADAILNITSGDISRLFYAVCIGNDANQIPVIDTMDTSEEYSEYLSYDTETRLFTVLKDFSALIVLWTSQYRAANTYAKGAFYINDTLVTNWAIGTTAEGSTGGATVYHDFSIGDTFNLRTPNSDGYPQQFAKLYKVVDSPFTEEIFQYSDEEEANV